MALKDLSLAVNAYRAAKGAAQAAASGASTAAEVVAAVSAGAKLLSKLAKALPVIGLVITVGITWGLTIAQLTMDHVAFGSAQFMNLIAEAIAATIVAVIMFTIASIPGLGQLIAAIVAAVDAVIGIICSYALSKKQTVGQVGNKGFSGLLGEYIKNFIYSRRSLVGNMSSPDRLDYLNVPDMLKLVDPEAGMVQGANTALSLELRNTIIRNTMLKCLICGNTTTPISRQPPSLTNCRPINTTFISRWNAAP
jgi:hypothetical protein